MNRQRYTILLMFLKYKYFFYFELKWLIVLSSLYMSIISYKIKQFIYCKLNFIFYKSTIVKLKSCCLLSSRCFAVNKSFYLSRFNTRRSINNGWLTGYRRNSW
jgi:ribosomal protein S14